MTYSLSFNLYSSLFFPYSFPIFPSFFPYFSLILSLFFPYSFPIFPLFFPYYFKINFPYFSQVFLIPHFLLSSSHSYFLSLILFIPFIYLISIPLLICVMYPFYIWHSSFIDFLNIDIFFNQIFFTKVQTTEL